MKVPQRQIFSVFVEVIDDLPPSSLYSPFAMKHHTSTWLVNVHVCSELQIKVISCCEIFTPCVC